jgi:hypothetical protein
MHSILECKMSEASDAENQYLVAFLDLGRNLSQSARPETEYLPELTSERPGRLSRRHRSQSQPLQEERHPAITFDHYRQRPRLSPEKGDARLGQECPLSL